MNWIGSKSPIVVALELTSDDRPRAMSRSKHELSRTQRYQSMTRPLAGAKGLNGPPPDGKHPSDGHTSP